MPPPCHIWYLNYFLFVWFALRQTHSKLWWLERNKDMEAYHYVWFYFLVYGTRGEFPIKSLVVTPLFIHTAPFKNVFISLPNMTWLKCEWIPTLHFPICTLRWCKGVRVQGGLGGFGFGARWWLVVTEGTVARCFSRRRRTSKHKAQGRRTARGGRWKWRDRQTDWQYPLPYSSVGKINSGQTKFSTYCLV